MVPTAIHGFLVKKKEANKYRLINNATEINRVTIQDTNLPPSADEFSEDFAGCAIASLIDLFSGYDQIELDETCRDMTAFMTPLGLMRNTTLPQGATNSVAQFCRVITKILQDHIPHIARPFLDDILFRYIHFFPMRPINISVNFNFTFLVSLNI
jgi:hypothetical protein